MAPPALNLSSATFQNLNIFTSSASPLRNNFALSCRSPRTPSDGSRPLGTPRRAGSFLELPSTHLSQTTRTPPSRLGEKASFDYDSEDTIEEGSPTDATWFLPHSPGLPPQSPVGPGEDGKLGVLSAINIIVGKTMGVGAYSVPSAIFSGVGSVGMTLTLWVVGSLISFCGLAVYMDLGTAIPRSGGERVYLERIFRKPYMLGTCMFMSYVVLLGFSTPNAIVLGEHALYATGAADSTASVRLIAVLAVSILCYIHARYPRMGLGLINVLGVAKVLILVVVVVSGVAGGLLGVGSERETMLEGRRLDLAMAGDMPSSTAQRNFHAIWEGSSSQPYDYATALLKVLYCFRGYSTANQVLSDVRNPVRTLKIAAPVALTLVSIAYLAINIAFFLVVDKDEFRSAGVVVAGVFFRKVFGDGLGAHILPLFVVVSAAGNIAATSFAQARVNEELAKEGILPAFWLSKPANIPEKLTTTGAAGQRPSSPSKSRSRPSSLDAITPSRGLLLHWLVSVAAIVIPPPGKIFNFLVDIGGYPVSVISVAVSLGLLYLHSTPDENWNTPYKAPHAAIVVFAASNCLLLVLPWIPPKGGMAGDGDGRFPSWAYPATSLLVLGLGAVYWIYWRTKHQALIIQPERKAAVQKSCCSTIPDDLRGDDDGESSSSSGDTIVVEEETRRKSMELLVLDKAGPGICGCRACPQVRRRALCGCPHCPARKQNR
ncbi:hypothetical protein N0V93_009367 [Gnomoniopsis smithogilvyi]|uniref:Amino acid transporter n=1 Tax=Gnomoniopsis smithogilvyi TaxID=1191159 RepID=A0A9W9CSR3_9PEZI|nr:hypothetical protein N0V93_009367 [Gnomoniopsis smithogilvyi]